MIQQPDLSQFRYLEGEQLLISYLLHNQFVDDITTRGEPGLFTDGGFRKIFEFCVEYSLTVGKGQVWYPDIFAILKSHGRGTPEIEQWFTEMAICSLAGKPQPDYIFDELTKHFIRRQTAMRMYDGLQAALDVRTNIKEVISDAEEALLSINTNDNKKLEVILPSGLLLRRKTGLELRMTTEPIKTGWSDFDEHLTYGFAPAQQSIIAGRTSMGKSFFKTNVIINLCKRGIGVINVCPEQGFDTEQDRIDAIISGIHLQHLADIQKWKPGDERFTRLKQVSEDIASTWNYAVVPSKTITVAGVQAAIRRTRRTGFKPQVVFIDLFDRLDDVNVAANRRETFAQKLGQIGRIAEEEQVHICMLVQVGRAAEAHKDKRPTISELKECGDFEQNADLIFLLYREGYYNRDIEDNYLEVQFGKQRNGTAGITFQFMIADKATLSIFPMGLKKVVQEAQGS